MINWIYFISFIMFIQYTTSYFLVLSISFKLSDGGKVIFVMWSNAMVLWCIINTLQYCQYTNVLDHSIWNNQRSNTTD